MQLTLLPGIVMQLKIMTYLAVTYYRTYSNLREDNLIISITIENTWVFQRRL